MTMTTVEVLRAARERIEDPAVWGRGDLGRVPNGLCAHLAIGAASDRRKGEVAALQAFARAIGHKSLSGSVVLACEAIWTFNDHHSHAEVLAAFDQAIANEEARESEFTAGHSPVEIPTAVLA